ncbi:glutathione S-transferase [Polymorphobacter multimanifer]|uniref:Glutathione S-transferase n=1 Tax=Polymorphobacter multimanifer TaxID=1070431 RepID=A0A841L0D0_9SPHN|nr:glutathione S-transferase family protein [Polymorphobacter multimanifer]MBB6226279.1 glutathione S-transferase [Polymorphobacter multimanifer]
MMLYTAADPAPNPRRVHLFLAAKALELPRTELSLLKREHKLPETLARNPRGQVPFLELDDGRVLAETISICRYLDELHPEPPMFGTTPFERAETDMWIRRVESALGVPVGLVWQHGHPLTARLVTQIPEMAAQARLRVAEAMTWLDQQLGEGAWLAGARPTMADITLLTTLDFAGWIGLPLPETLPALQSWHGRATARFAAQPVTTS